MVSNSKSGAIVTAGLHYGGEVHRSWKKGRFSIVISRECNSWPVGVYTRWRKQWWWTFLMDDKMTWPSTWRHFLELGFSGGRVPCPASGGQTRNSSSEEAQLNKNYSIAFNCSPAHSSFASNNHVLAKHSWPTGGLLHRSVNRPIHSSQYSDLFDWIAPGYNQYCWCGK